MISANSYIGDQNELLDLHFNGRQAMLWTALPGIIEDFDSTTLTCSVQPAIQGKVRNENGSISVVNLPLLLDCPVVFPRGGGCSLTFPIKRGDECLVVFSCRAIDFWWQNGGVQPPAEVRMHDLSDGFVLPGPYSQPNVIQSVNMSAVELRSDDHSARIAIHPDSHLIELETSGNFTGTIGGTATVEVAGDATLKCPKLTIDCPETTMTGKLTVAGLITGSGGFNISGGSGATATVTGSLEATGDIKAGSISLQNHVHGGITPGGGDTGFAK